MPLPCRASGKALSGRTSGRPFSGRASGTAPRRRTTATHPDAGAARSGCAGWRRPRPRLWWRSSPCCWRARRPSRRRPTAPSPLPIRSPWLPWLRQRQCRERRERRPGSGCCSPPRRPSARSAPCSPRSRARSPAAPRRSASTPSRSPAARPPTRCRWSWRTCGPTPRCTSPSPWQTPRQPERPARCGTPRRPPGTGRPARRWDGDGRARPGYSCSPPSPCSRRPPAPVWAGGPSARRARLARRAWRQMRPSSPSAR